MAHDMERSGVYRIEARGALAETVASALGGMRVVSRSGSNGAQVLLEGQLSDQAALLGVLHSLLQLEMELQSVRLVEGRE